MLQRKRSTVRLARRASATVELALILPVLCFLFVAAVDYARVFYFGVTLENCARNGAYYASNYPNASYVYNDIYGYKTLDEAILKDAQSLYSGDNDPLKPTYQVRYAVTPDGPFTATTPAGNKYVRVTVFWTFRPVTKFPGIPSEVHLARAKVMQIAPALPDFPEGVPFGG